MPKTMPANGWLQLQQRELAGAGPEGDLRYIADKVESRNQR